MGKAIFPKKTLRDVTVAGQTVLLRADYNVPVRKGKMIDDYRLRASLPTLEYLLRHDAKIVIISHHGRPDGRVAPKYSLGVVASHLSRLVGRPVRFVDDCIGDKVKVAVKKMSVGEILLLENLRFYREEEANDSDFAHQLVKNTGARLFVQDGFGVVHRAHASTVAIADFAPSVAGLLVEKEWTMIRNVIDNPNRPLVAVVGGAKVADKIPMVKRLIDVADQVIIGGAIANNFLVQQGFPVGASLWEPDMDDLVNNIIDRAKERYGKAFKQKFILPVDVAVSKNGNPAGARFVATRSSMKPNNVIYDIGTKSINRATEIIERAGTVVWNGTLGLADRPNFAHASSRVALSLAQNPQIFSLVCGGDTVDFVRDWDVLDGASFSYLSSGGGSSLSLIAGEKLPGIDALL